MDEVPLVKDAKREVIYLKKVKGNGVNLKLIPYWSGVKEGAENMVSPKIKEEEYTELARIYKNKNKPININDPDFEKVLSICGYARYWFNALWILDSYPHLPHTLTNPEESALVDKLDNSLKPPMILISEVKKAYEAVQSKEQSEEKKIEAPKPGPTYTLLQSSDALVNHNFSCFKNGIVQMASQGNCQENIGRAVTSLYKYNYDRTQGPASAMSAIDATLSRRIFEKDCDMMLRWLNKYDPQRELFDYHSGYLTPKPGIENLNTCIDLIKQHGDEILINVQQVRIDNAGSKDDHWMTQVPCFAMALGNYDIYRTVRESGEQELLTELSEELLKLQYQAMAHLAVLKSKSQKLNQRIPLLLTPVGGGVFGNSKEAICNAIKSIEPIVKDANVDVVLSLFSGVDIKDYKVSFDKPWVTMSHDEIRKLPAKTGLQDNYLMETIISNYKKDLVSANHNIKVRSLRRKATHSIEKFRNSFSTEVISLYLEEVKNLANQRKLDLGNLSKNKKDAKNESTVKPI